MSETFQLVRLRNGSWSVHSTHYAETMHPAVGPAAEGRALYVEQLRLPERIRSAKRPFVTWDVGMGGAANAVALLQATRDFESELVLVSFDSSMAPLEFALAHASDLEYLLPYSDALSTLAGAGHVEFRNGRQSVRWQVRLGDFPQLLPDLDLGPGATLVPDAIFFDPFSPARNPEMWTLPLFTNLRCRIGEHPCTLATYSRSTLVRTALLLAGFFVGAGEPSGHKEETTLAATVRALLSRPLTTEFLDRVERSDSADPLLRPFYERRRIHPERLARLKAHPQFIA